MEKLGTLQVAPASLYGDDRTGFLIERLGYEGNDRLPSWSVPAWEEQGAPELEGEFPTREAAEAALRDHMQFA